MLRFREIIALSDSLLDRGWLSHFVVVSANRAMYPSDRLDALALLTLVLSSDTEVFSHSP